MAICLIKKDLSFVALLSLAVLSLGACSDMYSESVVNERRVQVREEQFNDEIAVAQLNNNYIANIAQSYTQSGTGPVNLTITYDPESKRNTAMRASDEAVRISQAFRKQGVEQVITGILPVREQGDQSMALLSYSSYQAAAPANCGLLPGMESPALEHDAQYRLGCTIESQFAKQIADPSDLLGDAQSSASSDGRVGSNVVDTYRTGAQNKPLKGESASD